MDIKLKGRKCNLNIILIFLAVCMSLMINLSVFIRCRFTEPTPYEDGRLQFIFSEIYNSVNSLMLYTDNLYGDIREDSIEAEVHRIKGNVDSFRNGKDLEGVDSKYYYMNDEEIRQQVINDFKCHIEECIQSVEKYNNIEFYSESADGTLHFTNTDAQSKEEFEEDTLDNYEDYIISKSNNRITTSKNLENIVYVTKHLGMDHDFYIRIAEPLKEGDYIYTIIKTYEWDQKQGYISIAGFVIAFIATIFCFIKLRTTDLLALLELKILKLFSRINIEVKLLMLGAICMYEIDLLKNMAYRSAIYVIYSIVILFIGIYLFLLDIGRIKVQYNYRIKEVLLKESILLKIKRCLRKIRLFNILLWIIANGIIIAILLFIFTFIFNDCITGLLGALAAVLLFDSYILSILNSINTIEIEINNIANGIYNKEIDINDLKVLKNVGENLNNIQSGLRTAVDKAVKSERMKSELITNVSHDLKTPLTSIISYVDLLSQENITEEQRKKYLGILKDKSDRLKVLIEDLFEVSKASSGSVELHMVNLDPVALLRQTLGEFQDKIENSNLKIIRKFPEEKVTVYADGRKTFRVFQNLIFNIFKYSMDGSRVYIEVSDEDEYVEVIFKNTSREELNFTEEEILQRFKRGDVSRSTEGSGLGLAIAKSLTEVQNGKFSLKIDGDLFKVKVKLRKGI